MTARWACECIRSSHPEELSTCNIFFKVFATYGNWLFVCSVVSGSFSQLTKIRVITRDRSGTKCDGKSRVPMSMPLIERDSLLSAVMVGTRLALRWELPAAEASRDPEPSGMCGQLCICEWTLLRWCENEPGGNTTPLSISNVYFCNHDMFCVLKLYLCSLYDQSHLAFTVTPASLISRPEPAENEAAGDFIDAETWQFYIRTYTGRGNYA